MRAGFFVDALGPAFHAKRMESVAILVSLALGFLTVIFAILRTTNTVRQDLRGDILRLEDRTDRGFAAVNARIDGVESRMDAGFARLHDDHRDLRGRLDRITDNLALRGLIPNEQ